MAIPQKKSETTKTQPIDHLNWLISIKGIEFITITLPQKKSPGVDGLFEEVCHILNKE